ncbi:hypothetical protein C1R22_11110, partial [Neisseria gonorrhoeae]
HSRAGGNPVRSVSVISKNCRSVKFLDSHFRGNDDSGIPNSNPPQPTYAHPTHLPYSPVPERADKVRCRRRAS